MLPVSKNVFINIRQGFSSIFTFQRNQTRGELEQFFYSILFQTEPVPFLFQKNAPLPTILTLDPMIL